MANKCAKGKTLNLLLVSKFVLKERNFHGCCIAIVFQTVKDGVSLAVDWTPFKQKTAKEFSSSICHFRLKAIFYF